MAKKKVGELDVQELEKKVRESQKKLHELEAQKKVYELEVQEFEAKIEAQLKVAKSRLYKAKMKVKKWYFKEVKRMKRKKYFHTLPPNWNNSKNYSSCSSLSSLSYSSSTSYLVPCPPRSSACPSPKKEDSQKKRKTASSPKEIVTKRSREGWIEENEDHYFISQKPT